MFRKLLACVLCFSLFSPLFAEEQSTEEIANDYHYYLLEPDIITNYITTGKRIGFVRITVELMVKSKKNYAILENNEPLIRDKIITIFGGQEAKNVKSIKERETIRQLCLDEINEVLFAETQERPVEELLFTKYLYQ